MSDAFALAFVLMLAYMAFEAWRLGAGSDE